jgi:PAS domain S-box-containing protein
VPDQIAQYRTRWPLWAALFITAALLLLGFGYSHYARQRQRLFTECADHLAVVGMLKANQISEWRRERLADAIRYAQGPALSGPASRFLVTPSDAGNLEALQHMLVLNRKGAFYENTFLVSTNPATRLSAAPAGPFSDATLVALERALATRSPVLSRIFKTADGREHIDTVAPMSDADGHPFAAFVLRADASDSLYPLIRFWPTESETAETILLERDGTRLQALSELRPPPGGSAPSPQPIIAVEAGTPEDLLRAHGVVHATDYRAEPVLADVRPIAGSNWLLVTKIDTQEILAEVSSSARRIALIVGLGILLAAALTAIGYRRRQVELYRNLYKAERDQRATQERFRTILYSIGDGVIVTDEHALVRQMNHVAEHLTGWKEAEALGKPLDAVFRIINEESRQPVENPVRRVLREGKIVGLANHTILVARDGAERPITDSGAPVRDERSALYGVVLVFRDQSSEHAAQQALVESERRIATLLNNLPGMAYRCEYDSAWTMRMVSEGCQPLLGYAPDELINSALVSYAELIHPSDRGFVSDVVTQSVIARRTFTLEYRIRTKSGASKWVWERGCAVMGPGDEILALEGFIGDITERKQAAEEQSRLERQLQNAQRLEAIGRLAGGVAHDFNNMLAVITSAAELALDRAETSPSLVGDLNEIIAASKRSAELVRQLLAFASKQPIMPRVLNLNSAISAMSTMLTRLLREDISFGWHPTPSLWNVRMDPTQIDQLLLNLIVNARDAISGVGHIQVETHNVGADALSGTLPPEAAEGDYVLLVVCDDGCGMSDETLAHIFEPFFTTKGQGLGSGLGLSTVYGIVKQNRGFIRVSSEPGKGTRFSIFLPREGERHADAGAGRPAPAAQPPEAGGGAGKTILLVEDEPALLSLTAALLRKLGHTVLAAGGPLEALDASRRHDGPIDLLMTDIVMPDMSGRDLCEQLSGLRPEMRCLFMSGYTADIIAHHGILQDDIHFLQKPFSKDTLVEQLREVFSGG